MIFYCYWFEKLLLTDNFVFVMTPPSSSWEYTMKMVMDGADAHRQSVLALIRTKSTLKAASIACGRNHGYFHQYLFQSKPRFLPEDVRIKLAQYLGIAENRLREPELFVNAEPPSSQAPEARPRLMVYGRGADAGIDMTAPVAEVDCPPSLLRVVDAFAAYVHNPDLTPWLPVGSLIYIDPSKPLRPDDFVLVKSGRTGRIAIYRGRTSDSITLDSGNGQEEKVAVSTLTGFWKIVSVEFP
jgi:hypothetical protein